MKVEELADLLKRQEEIHRELVSISNNMDILDVQLEEVYDICHKFIYSDFYDDFVEIYEKISAKLREQRAKEILLQKEYDEISNKINNI